MAPRWGGGARRNGCANETGVGRNRQEEIAQGNALGIASPNQPSPERAKHGSIPHITPRWGGVAAPFVGTLSWLLHNAPLVAVSLGIFHGGLEGDDEHALGPELFGEMV